MIRIAASPGLRAFLWDVGNPGPSLNCEVILTGTWISFSHILGDAHNSQVTSGTGSISIWSEIPQQTPKKP